MADPISQADLETAHRQLVERHNRIVEAAKDLEKLPLTATNAELAAAVSKIIALLKG